MTIDAGEQIQPDQREQESRRPSRLISFLDMSPEDREQLIERIRKFNNTVQIWVHTHYNEELLSEERSRDREYSIARRRMIKAHRGHTMPIIAFIEEEGSIEELEKKYRERYELDDPNGEPKDIYYVLTRKDDPTPSDTAVQGHVHDSPDDPSHDERWDVVRRIMKELGIEHALLRGRQYLERQQYAQVDPRTWEISEAKRKELKADPSPPSPNGCLGITYTELRRGGIDARISNITYPNKPDYVRTNPPHIPLRI